MLFNGMASSDFCINAVKSIDSSTRHLDSLQYNLFLWSGLSQYQLSEKNRACSLKRSKNFVLFLSH